MVLKIRTICYKNIYIHMKCTLPVPAFVESVLVADVSSFAVNALQEHKFVLPFSVAALDLINDLVALLVVERSYADVGLVEVADLFVCYINLSLGFGLEMKDEELVLELVPRIWTFSTGVKFIIIIFGNRSDWFLYYNNSKVNDR